VDLKRLRRNVALTQAGAALAVPLVYVGAMGAGLFLFLADLLLLVVVLDVLFVLQGRSFARAASVAPRGPDGPELPARTVEEADACFVRFHRADAMSQAAGLFVFLVAADQLARLRIAGGDSPSLLLVGVAGAFLLMAVGRFAARRTAWGAFAASNKELWESLTGLNRGRTASSAAAYLDWRSRVRVEGGKRG
jgi:hypothetical protein